MILSGKPVADTVLENIKESITSSTTKPHLAVVLVWQNDASESYIRMKRRACERVGFSFTLIQKEAATTEEELIQTIEELNTNPHIHGIIVQSPIPGHMNYQHVIEHIDPKKDVDGFTPYRIGNLFLGESEGIISCTPKGIKRMLDYYHVEISGKNITILGRSNIVGKPLSLLLANAGGTITLCNSKTKDLAQFTKNADIVIVATGKKWILQKDMIRPDAVIIDVGCTIIDGKAHGDLDTTWLEGYCSYSPVPGWVGPMTVAMLLENTLLAYNWLQK